MLLLLTDVGRGRLYLCSFADSDSVLSSHVEDVLGERLEVLNHQLIYITIITNRLLLQHLRPTCLTHIYNPQCILHSSLQWRTVVIKRDKTQRNVVPPPPPSQPPICDLSRSPPRFFTTLYRPKLTLARLNVVSGLVVNTGQWVEAWVHRSCKGACAQPSARIPGSFAPFVG